MLRWFARRLEDAQKEEKGFTLIELLVVIIIIAILAAIAIPAFLNQRERAWEANAASDVRNAAAAANACSASEENNGSYLAAAPGFDCGDPAVLEANFGFNPSEDVDINGMDSDANNWATSMQHESGGDAYTFHSDTGRVTNAGARGAATMPAL